MQVRSVSWPAQGDVATFRRRSLVLGMVAATMLVVPLVTAMLVNPLLVRPALPLVAGTALLAALWIHGAARESARRAEVERSFAGLSVLHHGAAYRVDQHPVLGSYSSRRHAASAALDRGGWALVVRAWDRYWLLAATPAEEREREAPAPVSFRSRAVADVIPAIA
ncbi:MAG: hypothetical protein KDC46_07200 [Thermoleophilia bacterium]|nr:hypothetical protein [Thermoleophilia bacterium]